MSAAADQMLLALREVEGVLADLERILDKRLPGPQPLQLPVLKNVRAAIAAAEGEKQ